MSPTKLTLRLSALLLLAAPTLGSPPPMAQDPIPIFAYYYIWFDANSWERAKSDLPVLGKYSSDDRKVIEQHVSWAKQAGIDGFIVSWKSTDVLDRRLDLLDEVASEQDFKLWIIYQGLDFHRRPLPVERVLDDLASFVARYSHSPAFQMYERPVAVWSGTWEFSRQDIAAVAGALGDRLYLLASERSVDGYLRLADLVDGNAYYWSSVNPDTFPNYPERLAALGRVIHQRGGLWVAPAAPGFDARLVGGTSVVPRNGGKTFNRQLDTAMGSEPDVIGIISWNEFSENSHIEPSRKYHFGALRVLSARKAISAPTEIDFDSSSPGTTASSDHYPLYVIAAFLLLVAGSLLALLLRQRH